MKRADGGTQARAIFSELERGILSGQIPPRSQLEEGELARRFGVSRTPVRDALNLLAHSSLIVKQPRRGFVVVALDVEQIIQMFEVAANITGFAAKLATNRMSITERAKLREYVEQSEGHMKNGDVEAYQSCAQEFHLQITEGSHNDYLIQWVSAMGQRLTPYHHFHMFYPGQMETDYAEHLLILDAFDRRDGDLVYNLVSKHASIGGAVLTEYTAISRAAERNAQARAA